ncbi:MAG: acetyl-CoA synthase subunit gamma [Syntrophobacterales bacterium]|nr:acetyl-CoA synthase subunit gamma [Syntrophobacterales bacterium]
MSHMLDPGLYALGRPGPKSPVMVTANYKMTFDRLRASLTGMDVWILVLDTNGINVWCAAGKGTFGTDELVNRIKTSELDRVVSHRELILPQLAAPGVAAHEVRKRTGFLVIYGPVDSRDIPLFLKNGLKATSVMREKTFTFFERLVLVPIELVAALKIAAPATVALAVFSFFLSGLSWPVARDFTILAIIAMSASIMAGAIFTPLFLPWLPGRRFSLKGFIAGLIALALMLGFARCDWTTLQVLFLIFSVPAMAAYLAMNFTGCTTFTSLSGVYKEMRWALPLEIAATGAGLAAWTAAVVMGA